MIRIPDLARRFAPWLALALAALVLALAGPAACKRSARIAAEQRVERAQRDAGADSARDAIATAAAANERERRSDDITIRNHQEIRNAQGADMAVDPHATGAGLDGLCRRAAYRDSERCRLRRAAAR
ncbi:MAG TPA: hypothetical protein VFO42_03185 [Sphingomicrobium sp.]|nr:hypothetical protein [Sphingomicrobium sp.]